MKLLHKIKNLFNSDEAKTCSCHGYEIQEGKLPVKRTASGFQVCPKAALESSLQQMGSGIKLSPELAVELRKRLKEIDESKTK